MHEKEINLFITFILIIEPLTKNTFIITGIKLTTAFINPWENNSESMLSVFILYGIIVIELQEIVLYIVK